MNAIALIRRCKVAGIRLQARGNLLHVQAPAESLTPELMDALTEHKAAVLALHAIRARLHIIALSLGIPRVVVDELPVEELEATAEQAALSEGYADGDGDPYAHSLLTFYLRGLAERVSARA